MENSKIYFTFVNIVFLKFYKTFRQDLLSKACVDIDARKNNFNNFNKQWLFDKIGESSEWIVKSSHHRDPSSHIVPQSKEVDDPGQQHPPEYHTKCKTSHVSRGVALLIGHMCSRVSSTASLVQSEDQSIIKITLQATFTWIYQKERMWYSEHCFHCWPESKSRYYLWEN